jgi:hypothetical protein
MMSSKKLVLSAAISALLAAPMVAKAEAFLFNPTGGGQTGAINATLIDQAPGNALASGANSLITPGTDTQPAFYGAVANTKFTLYYQANLSVLKFGNNAVYTNGDQGAYFTFTAGFGEVVKSVDSTTTNGVITAQNINFGFDSTNTTTNFFNIYKVSKAADDLSGTGFVSNTLIYSGVVTDEPASTILINTTAIAALDQYDSGTGPVDNYPGIMSFSGIGAADIVVRTTSFDPMYFPNLRKDAEITSSFNTSVKLPFNQVDPAACFASATDECSIKYVIGGTNGIGGPDVLLQADANQVVKQLITPTRVPEPATTVLLGLGLALVGVFAGRGKKQQQA